MGRCERVSKFFTLVLDKAYALWPSLFTATPYGMGICGVRISSRLGRLVCHPICYTYVTNIAGNSGAKRPRVCSEFGSDATACPIFTKKQRDDSIRFFMNANKMPLARSTRRYCVRLHVDDGAVGPIAFAYLQARVPQWWRRDPSTT